MELGFGIASPELGLELGLGLLELGLGLLELGFGLGLGLGLLDDLGLLERSTRQPLIGFFCFMASACAFWSWAMDSHFDFSDAWVPATGLGAERCDGDLSDMC